MRLLLIVALAFSSSSLAETSTCYGTTSDGSLDGGVRLPSSGTNFTGYSSIARIAGRTYVHSEVEKIVVEAYSKLEVSHPDRVFKYAETGFKDGGEFSPHITHRNGLSIDFMVPVQNRENESVHLPTHPFNKFGYNIEFDEKGKYQELEIDYEAMAAHIATLHKIALEQEYDLWRVIFDPELQPFLFETEYGEYLEENIQFSERRSWVRHDEHYHVDFDIPCKSAE